MSYELYRTFRNAAIRKVRVISRYKEHPVLQQVHPGARSLYLSGSTKEDFLFIIHDHQITLDIWGLFNMRGKSAASRKLNLYEKQSDADCAPLQISTRRGCRVLFIILGGT